MTEKKKMDWKSLALLQGIDSIDEQQGNDRQDNHNPSYPAVPFFLFLPVQRFK